MAVAHFLFARTRFLDVEDLELCLLICWITTGYFESAAPRDLQMKSGESGQVGANALSQTVLIFLSQACTVVDM